MRLGKLINRIAIIELVALLFCVTSCSAKEKKDEKECTPIQRSETMLRKVVGDSIADIIIKANTVEISYDSASVRKLRAEDKIVVRYLIADTCNYVTDTEVFGQFRTYLSLKFTYRKRSVIAQFDFRLHKWMIIGKDKKTLRRFDLINIDVLKYAMLAFPDNKALIEIQKEQEQ